MAPFLSPTQYKPIEPDGEMEKSGVVEDPVSPEDFIKTWMWLPGLLFILVLTCSVMKLQYEMPIGEVLLALLLAFFFSFLAIQSTGATGPIPFLI